MHASTTLNDASSCGRSSSSNSNEGLSTSHGSEKGIQSPPSPVDAFQEGGLQGWLTVIGGTLTAFATFGVVQSYGAFQDYYTRTSLSQYSPSQISWIGSVQVFLVFSVGLPAGQLLERGYFHHCMLSGTLLFVFSSFMLSLCQPQQYYQHFLTQGIGMGLGMGLMFLPALTMSSHYFRKKRSLAMGIVVSGSSIGACVYPALLNNLFESRLGFGWGVRSVAFIDLGLLAIANFIMRPRLRFHKHLHGAPPPATFGEVMRDVPFLVFGAGTFLVFWGVFVPFFYLQLYAALHSVDPKFIKYALTIMNASSILGRTVPNIVADHYGPLNVLIACSLVSGSLMFALFAAKSVGGVAAFAVFYGFFSGGVISLAAPAVASFVTHSDLSDLGIRIGVLSFALAFALLTGNPIAGALLTAERHWQRPLSFAAAGVFAGAICYLLVWKSMSRRKKASRV